MAQIRFKGFQTGQAVSLSNVKVGANSGGLTVPAFQAPQASTALPRISSGQAAGDLLTLDTTGLSNVTSYLWREVSGSTLGTSATFDSTGHGMKWVECVVTCDQGALVSPAVMIYMGGMMGNHAADDAAILALIPHHEATHIATGDGLWSDPALWSDGRVPANGAVVLIPRGRTVTYDNEVANVRLDRVRVDGTLTWALDRSTRMLVETVVGTRGSSIIIGTSAQRLPTQYTAEIVISGKDYSAQSYTATDLNIARDPRLWGRGIIAQGLWRIWGAKKTTWMRADAGVPAGATSLRLEKMPVGIVVGDEICIGGTDVDYTPLPLGGGQHAPSAIVTQDEYRTLTGVDGAVLSWAQGLSHNHTNQLEGSTRTDLHPVVMVRRGKNVIVRSEVIFPTWRRGHTANVHMHCKIDLWDADFFELGRTDKAVTSGARNADGDFRFHDGTGIRTEPLSARSNIQSRYPLHAHHAGFDHTGDRPIYSNCYVEGVPGHAMVHHGCDVDMFDNAMHRFYGCGMVSESANEVGGWVGNLALTTTNIEPVNYALNPKNLNGTWGDDFRHGFGFGMRGRAMRTNRNVANSVTWGHVFFHRGAPASGMIAVPVDLNRNHLDIKTPAMVRNASKGLGANLGTFSQFIFTDYPILHFSDNEAIATVGGMFVTKQSPQQRHDVNVKIKRFRSWGYHTRGAEIEYIAKYLVDGFDLVAGTAFNSGRIGLSIGGNTYQVGTVHLRAEGNALGVQMAGSTDVHPDVGGSHDAHDPATNPRWFNVAMDDVDNTFQYAYTLPAGTSKSGEEVSVLKDDWDDTAIQYDQDVIETLPLEVGVWTGSAIIDPVTDANGGKVDNLSAVGSIVDLPHSDPLFPTNQFNYVKWRQFMGYWQYGGNDVLITPYIFSDRLTARPHKVTKMVRVTAQPAGSDNGAFDYTETPVVQDDMTVTVATDATVVVDVLAGASGGGGAGTYALDGDDFISPDHGRATLNAATGEVSYTPDREYAGTDEMYVFIKSHGQYKTVRISVLIGAGGPLVTPVPGTHFTTADHALANTIGVTLKTPPSAGARRIDLVQYSTDGGATWRRLCNGWVQAVHKVSTQSNGAALSAGPVTIRLRYKANYDFARSTPSGADVVTLS